MYMSKKIYSTMSLIIHETRTLLVSNVGVPRITVPSYPFGHLGRGSHTSTRFSIGYGLCLPCKFSDEVLQGWHPGFPSGRDQQP